LGTSLPSVALLDSDGHPTNSHGHVHYYYRSSLCSSPEGAPICVSFERRARLRLLESRRFPSISSLPWLSAPAGDVECALYVVE
jgi:hypothetical protein